MQLKTSRVQPVSEPSASPESVVGSTTQIDSAAIRFPTTECHVRCALMRSCGKRRASIPRSAAYLPFRGSLTGSRGAAGGAFPNVYLWLFGSRGVMTPAVQLEGDQQALAVRGYDPSGDGGSDEPTRQGTLELIGPTVNYLFGMLRSRRSCDPAEHVYYHACCSAQ